MNSADHPPYEYWLRKVHGHISSNFSRAEPRQRAWTYLCRLAGGGEDWRGRRRHLASYAREERADGAQRLLTTTQWDEDRVRDDLLNLVVNRFGTNGGSLYLTEAAFRKKGSRAAAVERQFNIDSRRRENCQVAVVLLYRTPDGHLVFIDRELYVPMTWVHDEERRRQASIPVLDGYRSKSRIAADMVSRALAAGLTPEWVASAVHCPDKPVLQRALRSGAVPHVSPLTPLEYGLLTRARAAQRPAAPPQEIRIVDKGGAERWHITVVRGAPEPGDDPAAQVHYLACVPVRWAAGAAPIYLAYTGGPVSVAQLADVLAELSATALRWRGLRRELLLDHYEVRSWRGWHRHMTLAMAAQTAIELARLRTPRIAAA